jgi:hypothetical protein
MTQPRNPLRHTIVGAGATVFGMHRPAYSLPTTESVGVTDFP